MSNTLDKAIKVCDATRGHEIVVKTENYLRSVGKNNSTGKYDRVVRGVKSLLEQGFLEGPELDRAIRKEADRLLRKYNPNDNKTCSEDAKPITVAKVIETKGKYSIIQDDRGMYWVTVDKTGHGGGTMEFSLDKARKTLNDYVIMDKLEAKYGKQEGYKRWMRGETDSSSAIDKAIMACDSISDLKNAIPVGRAYVKQRGYDFAVYDANGKLIGVYATPGEAESAAKKVK